MPQRRITCPQCSKTSLIYLGLYDTDTSCPKCERIVKVKPREQNPMTTSSRTPPKKMSGTSSVKQQPTRNTPTFFKQWQKRYDILIDEHPDIDKEINKAITAHNTAVSKWERRRDDALDNLHTRLEQEKSLLNSLSQLWEKAWGQHVQINYKGSLLIRTAHSYERSVANTKQRMAVILDPNLQTGLLDVLLDVRGGPYARHLAKQTRELRKSVDKVHQLKTQINNIKTKTHLPDSLRTAQHRITDTEKHLQKLKEIQPEIQLLEKRLKSISSNTTTRSTNNTKTTRSGMNWKEAEKFARDYMRSIGYADARLTTSGRDGGIDIISKDTVAQVKWHVAQVGSPDLQALYGIASHQKKQAFFFAQRYSPDAIRWANQTKMAIFQFTPSGQIEPKNASARQAIK